MKDFFETKLTPEETGSLRKTIMNNGSSSEKDGHVESCCYREAPRKPVFCWSYNSSTGGVIFAYNKNDAIKELQSALQNHFDESINSKKLIVWAAENDDDCELYLKKDIIIRF